MEKITKEQIAKIHVLLNQLKLTEYKKIYVLEFSDYQAESTKDLTKAQATEFIRYLSKFDPCDRMRKKVFALAYKAGIIWGDTWADKKMNGAKLDLFLKERGAVRKGLNQMSKEELIKVVNQFEQIEKHNMATNASKLTKDLLNELNIPTETKRRK